MARVDTNRASFHGAEAPETLALQALVWVLGDPARADRLLGLTGLDPAELRAQAGEPATLAATLAFLEANEADLLAAADALDVSPTALVSARSRLEQGA